jgi:hypothetical protein
MVCVLVIIIFPIHYLPGDGFDEADADEQGKRKREDERPGV